MGVRNEAEGLAPLDILLLPVMFSKKRLLSWFQEGKMKFITFDPT